MRQLKPICLAVLLMTSSPVIFAADGVKHEHKVNSPAAQTLETQLNKIASQFYKANEPGSTVIVMKDGKAVLRTAFGMENLAKQSALQAQDVMRLGSITKQFTAVAIMMLAEEGKLKVTDTVQQHLPQYPELGKKITIAQLMTHTSGIPNYTSNPDFGKTMEQDKSVQEMLESFQNLPLEFEPGSQWKYSNSGYFLLGAIIEKASGMSYAKFVEQRIFVPLNMKHTAYEGHARSKQKQAQGYSKNKEGFEVSKKLSMSQPYAAGSLVSNVDDLAVWDAAIQSGKLLKAETWKQVFTPYDGKAIGYAYGWGVGQLEGSYMVSHGGGINGFATFALHLPKEKVYVAVLSNADSGITRPEIVANRLAAAAIGKPIPDFITVKLDAAVLDQYVGVYKIDDKNRRNFVRDGDKLIMTRTGGPRTTLQAYGKDLFFIDNQSLLRVQFIRNEKNEVIDAVVMQNGSSTPHPRTNETPPKEAVEISLSNEIFDTYVGDYEIAPNFILNVRREGNKFITQATNQPPIDMVAIGENVFIVKLVGAEIVFSKDSEGKVSQLVLKQGGRDMPAKKIK